MLRCFWFLVVLVVGILCNFRWVGSLGLLLILSLVLVCIFAWLSTCVYFVGSGCWLIGLLIVVIVYCGCNTCKVFSF